MSDRDLIDEVLSEREDPGAAGCATGDPPSRSESTPESGAADVGASRADSPAQRRAPRVAAPDDPHFKPDFGTKLGKDRKSKKTGRSR